MVPVFVAGSTKLLQMQPVALVQGSRGCPPPPEKRLDVHVSASPPSFAGLFPNATHLLCPHRVFFRRHYPLATVRFCGMDPENRK